MSEIYNEKYYKKYDADIGKIDYESSESIKDFLTGVADCIVKDFKPKRVLDAGCAMGYLVAALRDLGVEAYGVDISEYAISKVREDIKPYCVVGSLTEPLPDCLPKQYDLVVTIEVLEHMYEEDGRKAIRNLCALSDRIIFSSTPDDFTERTHFNVQQREYWARLFAAEGFFDDLNYRPTYLTPYASCFKKHADWIRQIEDYERNIRISEIERMQSEQRWQKAVEDKERHIQNMNALHSAAETQRTAQIEECEAALQKSREEFSQAQEQFIKEQEAEKERHEAELQRAEQEFQNMQIQYETEIAASEQRVRDVQLQYETELANVEKQHDAQVDQLKLAVEDLEREKQHTEHMQLMTEEKKQKAEQELSVYQEHYRAAIAQREDLRQQLT